MDFAASDNIILRLGGAGVRSGAALCLVGRRVAATHRGQALLGVVAGSAHRVDDMGWLGGGLGNV